MYSFSSQFNRNLLHHKCPELKKQESKEKRNKIDNIMHLKLNFKNIVQPKILILFYITRDKNAINLTCLCFFILWILSKMLHGIFHKKHADELF